MCFSASASFTAAAFLAAVSILTVSRATRAQRLFALIPGLFALQQASEGFVWLSITTPAYAWVGPLCTILFLLFALCVWPLWIPLSVRYMTPVAAPERPLLTISLVVGGLFSAIALIILKTNHIVPVAQLCHIIYPIRSLAPWLEWAGYIAYAGATIAPFFISSIQYMRFFGAALAASYLIAYLFYYHAFVSVWCFFSAVLSVLILFIITKAHHGLEHRR